MRLPTFSRQSGIDSSDSDRPAPSGGTPVREPADAAGRGSVAEPTEATTSRWNETDRNVRDQGAQGTPATYGTPQAGAATAPYPAQQSDPRATSNPYAPPRSAPLTGTPAERDRDADVRTVEQPRVERTADRTPVVAGPKPRASLLATLGLILGVASALLVLSGPLLGYGIGVAVLALILSLSGIHATGRRHVAGKTDALIGMVLSLGAIVVGVLALTGSLTWLGTDMQPVSAVRHWLDMHVTSRF